jgi:ATP-dependent RNA helicase DHX36
VALALIRERANGTHLTEGSPTCQWENSQSPFLTAICPRFLHPSPSTPPPRTAATPRPHSSRPPAAAALSPESELATRAREPPARGNTAGDPSPEARPRGAAEAGRGFDEPRDPAAAAARVVMLLASTVLRGRLLRPLRRPRPPIMPAPLFLSQNPNPSPASASPSMSSTNGVYVPPMRRLRSVIASTSGNLAPPPSVQPAWSPDWRADGRSLSPPSPPQTQRRSAALPPRPPPQRQPQTQPMRQQSAGYSRYAYDDFSEEESDREMDRVSVSSSSKVNGLLLSWLLN